MFKKYCFTYRYITSLKWQGIRIKQSDPDQIGKQDPDPYQNEKHDPDPDQKGLDPQHWSGVHCSRQNCCTLRRSVWCIAWCIAWCC
jgi:hypothetical protein